MHSIKQPEDIIVPFQSIGETDWEIQTHFIIMEYAKAMSWEPLIITPLTDSSIVATEQRLNASLPDGLKLFYRTFGIADIGEQLQPLDKMIWLQETWEHHQQHAPDFSEEDRIHLPHLITFSDYLGNGNQFCFHAKTHEVFYYDHDTTPYLTPLFQRIDDYIKACLIFCQGEFFDIEYHRPEIIERWCEDKVIELYGLDTVRKWQY